MIISLYQQISYFKQGLSYFKELDILLVNYMDNIITLKLNYLEVMQWD
jgi:hypothetical protein